MNKKEKEDLIFTKIAKKIKKKITNEYLKSGDLHNLEKNIFLGFRDLQKHLMETVIQEGLEKEFSHKKKV